MFHHGVPVLLKPDAKIFPNLRQNHMVLDDRFKTLASMASDVDAVDARLCDVQSTTSENPPCNSSHSRFPTSSLATAIEPLSAGGRHCRCCYCCCCVLPAAKSVSFPHVSKIFSHRTCASHPHMTNTEWKYLHILRVHNCRRQEHFWSAKVTTSMASCSTIIRRCAAMTLERIEAGWKKALENDPKRDTRMTHVRAKKKKDPSGARSR